MKTEEIIHGNKLISEFMNEKLDPAKIISDKTKGKNLWVNLIKRELGTDIPPYDTSWDWIMPVIEKIEKDESIAFMIMKNGWDNRGNIQVGIYKCFDVKENRERKPIVEKQGNNKIEVVWLTVVEFIKWHNKQNKK